MAMIDGIKQRTLSREKKLSISFALLASFVGAGVNMNGSLARASDVGPSGFAEASSSGKASKPLTGDNKRGEELYRASCIVCHGSGATGGIGPRLAGNPVLSNEQAFWKIVYEGRHVMPPLKGALTEQQMVDIQAWLKTLP
ncbi:MAG TPA: cytochrome c [Nitrospiraceae bacterium]|nr:cytochrome c [Nitrospiraceae bacterium]